jgi:superfamily I DNA/RNA helicase
MLAVEKARQLAQADFKVLLLTYNSNLAQWLAQITSEFTKIRVSTFHGLVRTAFNEWAELPAPTKQSDYLEKAEDLLFEALESIKKNPEKADKYLFDAVIVDEGQDFTSDHWIPIPDLLKDSVTGVLYVFFDDNQRIYEQLSHIPVSKEQVPLVLSDNCRNTKSIFAALQKYTNTSIETRCIGPEGRSVKFLPAQNDAEAQKALRSLLHELTIDQGAQPSQIVVLTPRREANSLWKDGLKLGNYFLKWDALSSDNRHIKVSTIHSFKGLESPIVILTEMDHAFAESREQLAYIGISRARNHLIVIGKMP